ncbi:MAG: hypothetical protein ACRDRM_01095 [Pseudonocardiaceae bacterium]
MGNVRGVTMLRARVGRRSELGVVPRNACGRPARAVMEWGDGELGRQIGAGAIADPQAATGQARNRVEAEIRGSAGIRVNGGKRVRAADGGTAVNDVRR